MHTLTCSCRRCLALLPLRTWSPYSTPKHTIHDDMRALCPAGYTKTYDYLDPSIKVSTAAVEHPVLAIHVTFG
jgi:hypothetical protein